MIDYKMRYQYKDVSFESLVERNEFSNSYEIRWKGVANRNGYVESDGWILLSQGKAPILLSISYIENAVLLTIKYSRKKWKFRVGDFFEIKLSNNNCLKWNLMHNSYMNPSYCLFGHYSYYDYNKEIKFKVNYGDLEQLKMFIPIAWRLSSESQSSIHHGDFSFSNLGNSFCAEMFRWYINLFIKICDEYRIVIDKEEKTSNSNFENECFVYLMVDEVNGYYKIGMSNNPEYREKTLQSEKPVIKLLKSKKYPTREIAAGIEKTLHCIYSPKNIRGEWFNLDFNDIQNIILTLT